MHISLIFRFPEALVFWAVFLWVMYPEGRLMSKYAAAAAEPQDAGTYRLIRLGNQTAMFAALLLSFLPWGAVPWPWIGFMTGTGFVLAGGIIRRLCFRVLGQYFTGVVMVKKDQPVIDRGLYHWVRHPSYTAGCLLFCGFGMALGNWLSLVVTVLVPCLIYKRRVQVEEAALLTIIGEPYREYMSRTKRFIPFIL